MEFLFVVAAMAGLLLAFELQRFPLSWLGRITDTIPRRHPARGDTHPTPAAATRNGQTAPDESMVELGLFTWPLIRRRLDALTEELARLDRDPDVFAKAFHTQVARSAYEALSAEASRLAYQPRQSADQTLDVGFVRRTMGPREELEL